MKQPGWALGSRSKRLFPTFQDFRGTRTHTHTSAIHRLPGKPFVIFGELPKLTANRLSFFFCSFFSWFLLFLSLVTRSFICSFLYSRIQHFLYSVIPTFQSNFLYLFFVLTFILFFIYSCCCQNFPQIRKSQIFKEVK